MENEALDKSSEVLVSESTAASLGIASSSSSSTGDRDRGDSSTLSDKAKAKNDDDDEAAPCTKRAKLAEGAEVTSTKEEAGSMPLRKFKKIPVFIVDYHNDVLEFIYRCLASRHLPLEDNILVHFDSHPDMVISREIPASASFDKETMLGELSIENWIMPACYVGHFNRVIWLKNSWCKQMPVGNYQFKIGHKNDKISVDCPLEYFISEGNYCTTEELQQTRNMQLRIYDTDNIEKPPNPLDFLSQDEVNNFILDIDLDFFSTSNPFLEIYKNANCYEQLKEIFHFESPSSNADEVTATTERRKQQLEALKNIFEHLEEKRTFEGLEKPSPETIDEEIYQKIVALADSLQANYADDEIDWLLIYDSGSTTDTNGLPHHISTEKELQQYFDSFRKFLQQLPVDPVAITMACSAEDDYCPKTQVSQIQDEVLKILNQVFGSRMHEKPILHYMDDEWDVMDL